LKTVRHIAELPHPVDASICLVPTMGAFHEGHLNLMRAARRSHDLVVVSLFVNPTQFGPGEDFRRYPRDLDRDAALAETIGVDILFAPSVEEVYPVRPSTTIHVPVVTERWEGAVRPGHFDGVATVVAKLFGMVRPKAAYFGQKDLQQTVVVQRMVGDLNLPVAVEVLPTTREPDGLAMSSRNAYLTPEERAVAPAIYRELSRCRDVLMTRDGAATAESVLQGSRNALKDVGFVLDYFELVERNSLEPLGAHVDNSAIIAAGKLGKTRLIDNLLL
jgi:pantoate--beta-alanine ligase